MSPLAFSLSCSADLLAFAAVVLLSASGTRGQSTDELCMFSPAVALHNQALSANGTVEAAAGEQSSTVKVEIFYESLCPYCHELLLESLKPMWENDEFRPHLSLSLFPAGNVVTIPSANVSAGYRFWHRELEEEGADEYVLVCQHGERECLGNTIQACAMKLLAGPADYLPLLFCMAEGAANGSLVEKASFECMQQLGIDAGEIAQCVRDPSTNVMMYEIANYSSHLTPEREYTPWVVVNGVHSKVADEGNLLGPVCAALGETAPQACKAGANTQGLSGVWGSVRGWLGVTQTSAEVKHFRANGASHASGPSLRDNSSVVIA